MSLVRSIDAPDIGRPNGHYSHASRFENLIFTAAQLPGSAEEAAQRPANASNQARAALANLGAVLKAAGASLRSTLRITVYVTDIGLWPEIDRVIAEVLGGHKPARAVVAVSALHLGYQVAMEAIAVADADS